MNYKHKLLYNNSAKDVITWDISCVHNAKIIYALIVENTVGNASMKQEQDSICPIIAQKYPLQ